MRTAQLSRHFAHIEARAGGLVAQEAALLRGPTADSVARDSAPADDANEPKLVRPLSDGAHCDRCAVCRDFHGIDAGAPPCRRPDIRHNVGRIPGESASATRHPWGPSITTVVGQNRRPQRWPHLPLLTFRWRLGLPSWPAPLGFPRCLECDKRGHNPIRKRKFFASRQLQLLQLLEIEVAESYH